MLKHANAPRKGCVSNFCERWEVLVAIGWRSSTRDAHRRRTAAVAMSGTGEWPSAEALERAAKAARELEGNKNAKAMIELGKREQDVKKASGVLLRARRGSVNGASRSVAVHTQAEEARKQAEAGAQAAQFAVEQERTRWEEQRKTIEFNAKQQTVCAAARGSCSPV